MEEGLKDARRAAIGSYECRCGGRERDIMVHWVRMVGRLAVAKTQKEAVATAHWCDWNSLIPIVASILLQPQLVCTSFPESLSK